MDNRFSKDFCMGCKRIVAQSEITGGKSFRKVICKRCLEEIDEMIEVLEYSYGSKPYWSAPPERSRG